MIRPVDDRILKHRQVNLRRLLRSISHAGADDRDRNVMVAGRCRPAVTRRIGGEAAIQAEHRGEDFQLPVVVIERCLIPGEELVRRPDPQNGQDVDRRMCGIFVDDPLHDGFNPHTELLPGFMARIADHSVADVRPAQAGHVDECHAPRAITEEEEIPRPGQRHRMAQIELRKPDDDPFVDGPFAGLIDPRVDMPEGIALVDQPFADRLVVGGPQNPHVKRDRIADQPPVLKIRIIPLDKRLGHLPQGKIIPRKISRQAVHGPTIVACRRELPVADHRFDLPLHVVQHRDRLRSRCRKSVQGPGILVTGGSEMDVRRTFQ